MTLLYKIFWELLYIAINVGIAKYQAYLFDKQQKKINHTLWAWSYFCCMSGMLCYDLCTKHFSWQYIWLWLSALTMHFPLFSAMLNYFRTPRMPFDYHNTADSNGSKIDLWLGKYYVPVWYISVLGWIALQFLIF